MKLMIGAPIKSREKGNVFKLFVRYMHGDADVYTTEKYTFPREQEDLLLEIYRFLQTIMKKHALGVLVEQTALRKFIKENFKEIQSRAEAMMVIDCTNNGCDYFAAVDAATITYLDENRVECSVTITE